MIKKAVPSNSSINNIIEQANRKKNKIKQKSKNTVEKKKGPIFCILTQPFPLTL